MNHSPADEKESSPVLQQTLRAQLEHTALIEAINRP